MLARSILLQFLLFGISNLLAQQPLEDHYARPVDSVSILCNHFLKIKFTDNQREVLCQFRWNMLFRIDETGKATLQEFEPNGNKNPDILDSLAKASFTMPGKFYPRIHNGQPVSSVYSIELLFPCPGNTPNLFRAPFPTFKFPQEKIKSYHKSNKRLDVLFAFLANQPTGNVASYLEPGFGGKIDIIVPCPTVNIGLVVDFSENKRIMDYPGVTASKQATSTVLAFVGLGFNRGFKLDNRQEFIIQFELMYAGQTIIHRDSNNPSGIVLNGWSPGLMLNYLLQIGKDQFWNSRLSKNSKCRRPVVTQNYLNVHGGFRLMDFQVKEASGWIFEIGIGFRLSQSLLRDYELK